MNLALLSSTKDLARGTRCLNVPYQANVVFPVIHKAALYLTFGRLLRNNKHP